MKRAWGVLLVLVAVACSKGDSTTDATTSPTIGTAAATAAVRVVSQNLLHGIACADDSDRCDLPDRVALFVRQLGERGCPDLVGVQEANEQTVALLREGAKGVCDGRYTIVWDDDPGLDREVVLTTRQVLGSERTNLAGPLRTALWVRVAAEVGVVDFVVSHLASSSDDRPCDATTCPPPCVVDEMVNACQARELVEFADRVAAEDGVVVIGGDLNAKVDEPAIAVIRAGGFTDLHLAFGNAECDETSGDQCTSGRIDDSLTDLTDPSSRQTERIDYLFTGGTRACEPASPTGLFNGEAAVPAAGGGLVFPADHTGVEATLACTTTDAQRETAPSATVVPAPTTTRPPGAAADPETLAAITTAFSTVFDGDVTDVDRKLAALEDGELLRPFFLASYEQTKEIASRIRVRIDSVALVDDAHADVVYTLLLDGSAVLDHLPGRAIRLGDQWLVTRRTYCDVSTQGATEIPGPCQ